MSVFDTYGNILAACRRWRRACLLGRFGVSERGSIAVLVALALVPLIGFVGIGTDVARAYLVKSRLSSALDSAALAGGRSFDLSTRDSDIAMFFNVNFPSSYMGATVNGPTETVDTTAETIQLHASADVPTTFMRLFGFDKLTVSADTEVTRRMTALDVVLSVDMSGSMGSWVSTGGTRIEAARNAATTLVDILFGSASQKQYLNIGIVPWSSKTNVMVSGSSYDSTQTTTETVPTFLNPITGTSQSQVYLSNASPVPLLSAPPSDWKGCVYNRYLDDGLETSNADVLNGPVSLADADWPAWQPVGPEGEPVSGSATCTLSISGQECVACINQRITPLDNQKQTILDAINALQNPSGSTNLPEGLGWAWRVLEPQAPFTDAVLNPSYDRTQAIVLLTDGQNYGGSGDGYKGVFGLGSTAQPSMDDRLLKLAANIKAAGVIVYVIQFANQGTDLQTLLKQVASGPDAPYYYYAPDGDVLQQAFQQIANHLSELRLSK